MRTNILAMLVHRRWTFAFGITDLSIYLALGVWRQTSPASFDLATAEPVTALLGLWLGINVFLCFYMFLKFIHDGAPRLLRCATYAIFDFSAVGATAYFIFGTLQRHQSLWEFGLIDLVLGSVVAAGITGTLDLVFLSFIPHSNEGVQAKSAEPA